MFYFVSKKFQHMTVNNKTNNKLSVSFVMCFIKNNQIPIKQGKICQLAAGIGSIKILK